MNNVFLFFSSEKGNSDGRVAYDVLFPRDPHLCEKTPESLICPYACGKQRFILGKYLGEKRSLRLCGEAPKTGEAELRRTAQGLDRQSLLREDSLPREIARIRKVQARTGSMISHREMSAQLLRLHGWSTG